MSFEVAMPVSKTKGQYMFTKPNDRRGISGIEAEPNVNAISEREKSKSRGRWPSRVAGEVTRRLRMALSAPSLECAQEIERQRALAQRQRLAEEYSQGYLAGWQECYSACLNAVEEELSQKCEIWAAGALLSGPDTAPKTN
jgi:hypothetical protein